MAETEKPISKVVTLMGALLSGWKVLTWNGAKAAVVAVLMQKPHKQGG